VENGGAPGREHYQGHWTVRATVFQAHVTWSKLSQQCARWGCFPPLVRVAFLRWPRLSASKSTHVGRDSACSAITKRQTILLMPCKAVPKAKQDRTRSSISVGNDGQGPSNSVTGSGHPYTTTHNSGSATPGQGVRRGWSSNSGTGGRLTRSGGC